MEGKNESTAESPRSTDACSNRPWHPSTLEQIQANPLKAVGQAMVGFGAASNVAQGELVFLVATAPRAGQRIYLKVMGPSSGAKSFTVRTALCLLPPELSLSSQQVTAAFLTRTPNLAGRCVILDEADLDHGVRQMFRLLVSEGQTTRNLVIGGNAESVNICGQISLIELHLEDASFDPQDSSRAFTIAVNTGADAVQQSIVSLIDSHSFESRSRRTELNALRSVFREFYVSLDPEVGVEIPRDLLTKIAVRSDRPTTLRFHVNLIALLKTVAFLRQHVKPKIRMDDREIVLVDTTDYEALFSLLQQANPRDDHEELTAKAAEAFAAIRPELSGGKSLDVYQISDQTDLSVPQTRRRLAELVEAGLIERTTRGSKNKRLYGLSPLGERSTWKSLYGLLPDPEELDGV